MKMSAIDKQIRGGLRVLAQPRVLDTPRNVSQLTHMLQTGNGSGQQSTHAQSQEHSISDMQHRK